MDPSRANSGVKLKKNYIMKLQKISEIQPTLPLTEFDFLKKIVRASSKANLVLSVPNYL